MWEQACWQQLQCSVPAARPPTCPHSTPWLGRCLPREQLWQEQRFPCPPPSQGRARPSAQISRSRRRLWPGSRVWLCSRGAPKVPAGQTAPLVSPFHLCPSWAHAHTALLFLLFFLLQPHRATLPPSRRIYPEPLCPGWCIVSFATRPASLWWVYDEPPDASSWDSAAVVMLCQLPQWHPHGTSASLTVAGPKGGPPPALSWGN